MVYDPKNPYGNLIPNQQGGGGGAPTVTPAAPAASAASAAPQPGYAGSSSAAGGTPVGDIGAPTATPSAPAALKFLLGLAGAGTTFSNARPPPDFSRPQTTFDWLTREYSPSPTDIAATVGNAAVFGQAATPSWLLEKAGVQLPQAASSDAIRQYLASAKESTGPAGPILETGGLISNPLIRKGLTAVGDWATSELGEPLEAAAQKYLPTAASKYLPQGLIPRAVSGGTQASATNAAFTAGAGGDPSEILKSAAEAFPAGALSSAVPPAKGWSPGDVTSSAAAKVKAAQEQLTKITIPEHELHFSFEGNQNPTVQDVLDYKAQMEAVKPGDDPEGGAPVVLKDIAKTIAPGTAAGDAIAARDAALQEHGNALLAQRWLNRVGVPGTDVRAEAAAEMDKYPEESPEQNAFKAIASVPTPPAERPLPPYARKVAIGTGTALGEGAAAGGRYMGLPYVPPPGVAGGIGAQAGNTAIDAINWLRRPMPLSPAIQQEVARQYPQLTGQPGPRSGDDDLMRALMYLNTGAMR